MSDAASAPPIRSRPQRVQRNLAASTRWRYIRSSAKWYPFVLANFVIFIVFTLSSWLILGFMSFHSWDMLRPPRFTGLENVAFLASDGVLFVALKNSLLYALMYVPVTAAFSLVIAILVNRPFLAKELFRTIYFLPVVTSISVLSILWSRIFSPLPEGPANYVLSWLGIPPQKWLADLRLALPSVAGLGLWASFGYYMVIWLAGLQGIPQELTEAAKVDGASSWQVEWFVTIPMLRPTATFIIMISTIRSLQVFGSIYILTSGGPIRATTTVVWLIWSRAFELGRMGLASATALLLFAIILTITLIQRRLLRMNETLF